ncbi:MAG: hydrolase, haloacid dehalogenase-like family [Devosia sp.]|uniref:HAD family hydrolase n=1 Tax=Devosia sp. TaxID=1871048 RepID=UPI002633E213|nr:HAD family phosphatase [Devosia sp.]MDB5531081.1 hydrolase, haloacid dehalogenase-like family [Devosia sp.]
MVNIVFDIGGVLIDWNPEHLYRTVIPNADERHFFLTEVCNPAWNAKQDLGRSWAEAEQEAALRFPQWADAISLYRSRWDEMVSGAIPGGFELLSDLHSKGHKVTGLSNWNQHTFREIGDRFPMLSLLQWVTVSGEVGLAKPDPAIYRLHASRLESEPAQIVFIDDNVRNIEAAIAMGWQGILFADAASTRADLQRLGLV